MDLPQRYPYNPRLLVILLVLGVGLLWIAVLWLLWGHVPAGFGLWFGLVPITLAVTLGVRRILFQRYLVLDRGRIVIPTGLFQRKTAQIEYASIERVWRHYLPATLVLLVATKTRTFEIVSVLLPDNASYGALESFLSLKAQENVAQRTLRDSF